jgi:predicted amino acid racemase
MSGPVMRIDLDAIEENARTIVGFCAQRGIEVTGVTKVTCGMPAVARALIRGGVTAIGESRLENIHRMRADGITAPFWLLRIPPLSAVDEIVTSVNVSLNSEMGVIRGLSAAAEERDLVHDIILMVDLGDLREGIWPNDLMTVAGEVRDLPGVRLRGLGTNLTCYGGVLPSRENMNRLVGYQKAVEDAFGIPLDILSGGNSSSLDLLRRGGIPSEVNNLRLGESLMLGLETANQTLWPGARRDAFVLGAELIEVKKKPSVPVGETGLDAFGEKPVFRDKGPMIRGILNIGREDVKTNGLTPLDDKVEVIGSSSDHLLVDLTSVRVPMKVGDEVKFLPDYGALLAAMTSSYVRKEPHRSGTPLEKRGRSIAVVGETSSDIADILTEDLMSLEAVTDVVRVSDTGDVSEFGGLILYLGPDGSLPRLLAKSPAATGPLGLIWFTQAPELSPLLEAFVQPEVFTPENTILIGLREAGPKTMGLIESRGIGVKTMEDIDLLGLRQVMRSALEKASSGTGGVILRYDAAVTDGGNEGLTKRETYLAMELAARSGVLRGMDISGSLLAANADDLAALRRYVGTAFGKKILNHWAK